MADRDSSIDSLQSAWADYCDALKSSGSLILSAEAARTPIDKPEGLRMLTRLLRYGLEAGLEFADPDFPTFYHPSHETLKISSDNPDTLHFMATIGDVGEYRITGTRGSVARIVFTTLSRDSNCGLKLQTGLATDNLQVMADGSFAISVAREKRPGNWLPLMPGAVSIFVRAIFLDRSKERPPTLKIARLDGPSVPPLLEARLLETRLRAAAQITGGTARAMIRYGDTLRSRGWVNQLCEDSTLWGAGDPAARYQHGTWALGAEEALLIEVPPSCFFWNFQINNYWAESLDYLHHRIHLNKASAVISPDGAVRIVVAHRDPGLPNWLDTAGHQHGTMLARWIDAERTPQVSCRVVEIATLMGRRE